MMYNSKISCTKESLKTARVFVKESLHNHGISELDIASMVLALDEILANLIIHSHKCNMDDTLEVEIEVTKEGVLFRIYDEDEIFDIGDYQAPSLDELVKTRRKGGMGLILVKKIMDDIEISRRSGKNCCSLYKKVDKQ